MRTQNRTQPYLVGMMGKMVWARRASVAFGLALAALACPAFNDEVSMAVEPVWGTGAPAGQVVPIRVTIQNDGPDRTGKLEARGLGISRVEFDMPRNSEKEVILYPAANSMGFESVEVTLTTQGGQIRVPVETHSMSGMDQSLCVVGLISDTLGGFSFIRNSNVRNVRFTDVYLKPGASLDRGIGYQSATLLFLGEGAERLSDREIGAIKRYVLMGGSLVFMGGSSAPILRDPRWADFLPITNPRATSLGSVDYLKQFGNVPSGGISIMDVDPKENTTSITQGGTTIVTKKAYGLGNVVVLGFNLTDQPLNKWTGRLQLFSKLMSESLQQSSRLSQHSSGYLAFVGNNFDDRHYPFSSPSMSSHSSSIPFSTTSTAPPAGNDPFRAKLPPTGTIFMILAGFWVVVIPVHFFILNKMKKGELAWFTAPLIALGFAGLLFTMASGLYRAGLSTALEGVLFRADGSDEAFFVGRQQLFFPNGGRYDLGLKGVEAILPMGLNRSDQASRNSDTSFQNDLMDIGEVIAPRANATNLNFKEFRLAEGRKESWRIPGKFTVTRQGNLITIKGTITNQSPYKLSDTTIFAAGNWLPSQGEIEPGDSKNVNVAFPVRGNSPPEIPVALWAHVSGIEAGARIGKPAAGRQQEILYSYGTYEVGG